MSSISSGPRFRIFQSPPVLFCELGTALKRELIGMLGDRGPIASVSGVFEGAGLCELAKEDACKNKGLSTGVALIGSESVGLFGC